LVLERTALGKVKHKRREGHWRIYDAAQGKKLEQIITPISQVVDPEGNPIRKHKRGRPPVHSPKKMALVSVLTVILGISTRNMESLLHMLKLPWQEPYPTTAPYTNLSNTSAKHTLTAYSQKPRLFAMQSLAG
jgi:hypothetical protein